MGAGGTIKRQQAMCMCGCMQYMFESTRVLLCFYDFLPLDTFSHPVKSRTNEIEPTLVQSWLNRLCQQCKSHCSIEALRSIIENFEEMPTSSMILGRRRGLPDLTVEPTDLTSGVDQQCFGGDAYASPADHRGAASSSASCGFHLAAVHLAAFSDLPCMTDGSLGAATAVYVVDEDTRAVQDRRILGTSGSGLDDEALLYLSALPKAECIDCGGYTLRCAIDLWGHRSNGQQRVQDNKEVWVGPLSGAGGLEKQ